MKKVCLSLILLLVSACGYSPLYKKGSFENSPAILEKTSAIDVKPVQTSQSKYGVILRNDLNDKLSPFGKAENIKYVLNVNLGNPSVIRRGINDDGSASIGSLMMKSNFQLIELGVNGSKGKVALKGAITDYSSFNILDNIYASEVSKDYAAEQLMGTMSDEIYKKIVLYLKSLEPVSGSSKADVVKVMFEECPA